jgi:predicted dehydrogenase
MGIQIGRRRLLAGAVTGAILGPHAVFGNTKVRAPALERLSVAIIGCGKMANDYHIPELLGQRDVQVVAVCEVDEKRREHAKNRVEKHYSTAKIEFRGCDAYTDFREVIARKDIDAVCIATPDHWHAIPLIEACKAGKDVYCEKPLTLSIAEAQRCVEAARKHKRIVQTGSQQRSNVFGNFREGVEFIRSGRLGKVSKVTVGVGAPSIFCDLPKEEMEPGLAWEMWLGAAPLRPYNSILSPRGVHQHFPAWRNYREYSGGGHTDMGAHHYDIALWALDLDHSGPVEIIPPDDEKAQSGVIYRFAGGVEIVHGGPSGCVFFGELGTLHLDRGVLKSDPADLIKEPIGEKEVQLFKSPGHHRNWLDCIKSRELPVADVEVGARAVSLIHLGNLAYWEKRKFGWNAAKWQFTDATDNSFLDFKRRDAWLLPTV